MLSLPRVDQRVGFFFNLPFLDFGESRAYVCRQRAGDRHPGHPACPVPKPLILRLSLSLYPEACRVTHLHVDAYHIFRVVTRRVPEATVPMLYAGLLDVFYETRRCRLPAVLFSDPHCQSSLRIAEWIRRLL